MEGNRSGEEGGGRELLRLALPLILSNSCLTLQMAVDRILLSRHSQDAVGAAMASIILFWTPLTLLQNTASYATTFVAQYIGAGRSHRVGPAIWQAIHFSVISGVAFLGFIPLAGALVAMGGHTETLQELEATYFRTLCFSALPTVLTAAVSGFFAGRGDSWTVLLIASVGMVVNVLCAWGWIPTLGIAGAGWATAAGMSASALTALLLLFRRPCREAFATLSGWRLEPELFGRLLRYGLPAGVQWMLDGVAFGIFFFLLGRLGEAELSASSIAFTINMVAFVPMMGMGQAVSVLVGQRLGQDRPDLAERTTWRGFRYAWTYMTTVAALYVFWPELFLSLFQSEVEAEKWTAVAAIVPVLLRFVAVYSLFDSMNAVFSFALRGAGDTRFVTVVALGLSWPIMVLPTMAASRLGWGIYWSWGFASAYIIAMALVFLARFCTGKWKTMRVIEPVCVESPALAVETSVMKAG